MSDNLVIKESEKINEETKEKLVKETTETAKQIKVTYTLSSISRKHNLLDGKNTNSKQEITVNAVEQLVNLDFCKIGADGKTFELNLEELLKKEYPYYVEQNEATNNFISDQDGIIKELNRCKEENKRLKTQKKVSDFRSNASAVVRSIKEKIGNLYFNHTSTCKLIIIIIILFVAYKIFFPKLTINQLISLLIAKLLALGGVKK